MDTFLKNILIILKKRCLQLLVNWFKCYYFRILPQLNQVIQKQSSNHEIF